MKRQLVLIGTLLLAVLFAGCVGKDFIRPPEGTFVLGKTSYQETLNTVGVPERTATGLKNGRQVKQLTYVYAKAYASTCVSGLSAAARVLVLSFDEDKLVGFSFASSFTDDCSDFDESKATQIVKGQTTEAQVREMYGRPGGEEIFPMVPEGKHSWVYSYGHSRQSAGSDLSRRTYNKTLRVIFESNGDVNEVEMGVAGQKL